MLRRDPRGTEERRRREEEGGNHSITQSLILIVNLAFRRSSWEEGSLASIPIQTLSKLAEEQPTPRLENINSAPGRKGKKEQKCKLSHSGIKIAETRSLMCTCEFQSDSLIIKYRLIFFFPSQETRRQRRRRRLIFQLLHRHV